MRSALIELLETAEIARLLASDDELIVQYHDWLYQNIDKRKPQPAPRVVERTRRSSLGRA